MLTGLIVMLGVLSVPVQASPAPAPTVPVHLSATLVRDGAACRFEVTGPPGGEMVLLASPMGGGSAPTGEHRLIVQLWHHTGNFLHRGTLPPDGKLAWRLRLPTDREGTPETYYLQAVVLDPTPPHRILGVSDAYRFRRGPPPALDVVRPGRSWWWLFLFLPLAGIALAPWVRRRPSVLRLLPIAALACLVAAPGPIIDPVRDAIHLGGRTDRALAAHVGADLAPALRAIRARVPPRATLRMPADLPIVRNAQGYLASRLYPRRLVFTTADARRALAAGRTVFALRREGNPPAPDLRAVAVAGAPVPGFRLVRLTVAGRSDP